ncbi:MAG: hypothetical protein JWP47_1892 [Polaromonas sp.]|jgi:hypothetical protein|nr:hypothetical protein [Polaromonas sp.]
MTSLSKPLSKNMRTLLALGLMVCSFSAVHAQAGKPIDKESQEDIARHRAMASAHESAAKCLESGKKHEVCEKELQAACKGLAIGKYCGMRHAH